MAGLQGRVFGGYQLAEQLGGGGIAEVYHGRPVTPGGRDVVVKVIYPEFARQPGFLPNFRQIVQMFARLSNHTHILPLIASGEEAGYLYLVSPYVSAGTLRDRIQRGGRLSPIDVGPFFRQLGDALGYAHSLGIVHGNIKPSNIYLFDGRHVLLGDFGLLWDVRTMDMQHSGSGTEAVEYMAPEMASGNISQLSDIYSVGAVLFAAIVSHAPFQGTRPVDVFNAHTHQPVPHLAQIVPSETPALLALDAVIQRAMAKRPDDRFPSATSLAQAVEMTLRQYAVGCPAVGPATPSIPPFPQAGGMPVSPGGAMGPGGAFPGGVAGPAGMMPIGSFGAGQMGMLPGAAGFGASPVGAAGAMAPGVAVQPAAVPPVNAGLGQLNPPFPPLPGSGLVDEQMEQSRVGLMGNDVGTLATAHMSAPGSGSDLPAEATLRMNAPQMPGGSGMGIAGASSGTPAGPGLGNQPGMDGSDGFGAMEMPAIRGLGARGTTGDPPAAGFTVAGGGRHWESNGGAEGAGGIPPDVTENAPLGDDRFDPAGSSLNLRSPYSGEQEEASQPGNGGWGHGTSDSGEKADYGASGGWGGQAAGAYAAQGQAPGGFGQPGEGQSPGADHLEHGNGPANSRFSATQLGLPRLTDTMVGGIPSWQDSGGGEAEAGLERRSSAPSYDHEGPADWGQSEAGGWSGSGGGDWGYSQEMSAQTPVATRDPVDVDAVGDPWKAAESSSSRMPAFIRGRGRRNSKKAARDDGFDDDEVWTVGTTAVRLKDRRWLRKLALFVALVLLLDMSVMVLVRPDLCPTTSCHTLSGNVKTYLSSLIPKPPPLSANPSGLNLTTVVGKSATAQVTVKNTTADATKWQASAQLPWVSVAPSSGTLAAGASVTLTITAKPDSVQPGTYASAVTLTVSKGTVNIPISIEVQQGPKLEVLPIGLTFIACNTSQAITVKNAGTGTLTFSSLPSDSTALTLSNSSGTLKAGATSRINVTLTCAASPQTPYTVNIVSNSGSAVINVVYRS